MPGGSRFPFRAPCGSDPCDPLKILFSKSPWRHYRNAEAAVPTFKNITTVPQGAGCAPFSMPPLPPGNYNGANACASPPPTGDWTDYPLPNASTTGNKYGNLYTPTGVTRNFARCRKTGFKNGQAKIVAYGRLPFQAWTSNPTTRYLKATFAMTYSITDAHTDTGDSATLSAVMSFVLTFDKYSGIYSFTDYSYVFTSSATGADTPPPDNIEGGTGYDAALQSVALAVLQAVGVSTPVNPYDVVGAGVFNDITGYGTLSTGLSDTEMDYSITAIAHDIGGSETITETLAYTCSLALPYTISDVILALVALEANIPFTDDVLYPPRTDGRVGFAPLFSYNGKDSGILGADQIGTAQMPGCWLPVYGGGSVIGGGWNTSDPASGVQYLAVNVSSWPAGSTDMTTFGGVTVKGVVTVTVSAGGFPPGMSLTGNILTAATDTPAGPYYVIFCFTGTCLYDGSTLGIFNPAGYGYDETGARQGHFDFRAINYNTDFTIRSFGAFTPSELPANCPQWTNWEEESLEFSWYNFSNAYENRALPKGAWATGNGRIFRMQKWAEIKCISVSQNFARPCGDDDLLVDFTIAGCGTLRFVSVPPVCDPTDPWNDDAQKGDFFSSNWFNVDGGASSGSGGVRTQHCIQFQPCCPQWLVCSPQSGDAGFTSCTAVTFPNAIPYLDFVTGGWVQTDIFQAMYDLLWQPYLSCGAITAGPLVEGLVAYPSRRVSCPGGAWQTPDAAGHPLPTVANGRVTAGGQDVAFPATNPTTNQQMLPSNIADPGGWPWQRCT